MTDNALRLTIALSLCSLIAIGCKKEEEAPPPTQANMVQQQPNQGYGQQPVQPAQPAQPAPTQTPAAAAASPTPSPLATPCKSDPECIGAKCNVAAGKCQFPCGSNNDCQAGWACALQMGQVCMPAPNTIQQQPAH